MEESPLLRSLRYLVPLLIASSISARADQPIFNEMPRWDNGWGVQVIREFRTESDLLLGDTVIGPGFSEDIDLLHFEGVYTWDKSIRLTFKLPYVLDARREVLMGGVKTVQRDEGIGDLTLALPLKRYFNLDQRSGSWTIAPQLRVPLAGEDTYEVFDNEWGQGVSFGYESETYEWIFSAGATAWVFYGEEPFEASASIDVGRNLHGFGSSGHINWETDAHFEDDGSFTLSAGPAFYWRINDTLHTRISWKHDFADRQGIVDHGNGDTLRIGIALVF